MPGGVDDQEAPEGQKRSLVEGPTLAVCLCIGLVLVVLFLFHDPNLVARNPITRAAGVAPSKVAATKTTFSATTTTLEPPATTTTANLDPPTTTAPRTVVVVPTTPPATSAPVTAPPAATTTTAPTYVAPHIATQTDPGTFGSGPGVVSASYSISTTGGVVSATGTWSGGNSLSLSVSCASGGSSSQQGSTGITVSATCNPGSATVNFAEIPPDQTNVSYSLSIAYPSN
jgi:hypothetical protein